MKFKFLLFLLLAAFTGWGQTTITYTFSSLGSTNINNPGGVIDSNISFTSATNSSGTTTVYNGGSGELRCYNNTVSPYAGGSITIIPNNGAVLNSIEFTVTSSYNPRLMYTIGAAPFASNNPTLTTSSNVYSLTGLSQTSSITFRNANISTLQFRVLSVKVTYTGGVSCSSISSFPFTESFETSSLTIACWTQQQVAGSANWTFNTGNGSGTITTAHGGTRNARFVGMNGNATPVTKLISPILDLTSITNPILEFWYGQEDWSGDHNALKVYYRVNSSSPWIEIWSNYDAANSWTEVANITLPNPSSTYQIAFEGINFYGRPNVLDDVTVKAVSAPQTYTWNGSSSSSWSTASNWTPNGVPGTSDNVIINVPGTNELNITSNHTINNFTLNGTGDFNMAASATLTINGDITYGGSATATLDCNSTVNIISASNQIIPPLTYGNLNALGGNRIFSPTGVIKICGIFDVNPSLHTYTVTGSTVEYISNDTGWLMTPFTYNNLIFSGSGDFTLLDGTITVNGNFTQSDGIFYLGYDDEGIINLDITGNMNITNESWLESIAEDLTLNVGGDMNISGEGFVYLQALFFQSLEVGGNLTMSDDSFFRTYYADTLMDIGGDLSLSDDAWFYLAQDNESIMDIGGDISLTEASLFDVNRTNAGYGILNLKGNLSIASLASLQANNTNDATFNFSGTGDGLTPETTQTIDITNASTLSKITFNVNNSAYVKLINQNLSLGTNSSFNVKTGGTFDFGFSSLDVPLVITNNGSGQSFTSESGSTLKLTSPFGLTDITGTTAGNVQTPVLNRTFNPGGIYHYIGKENQATGNAVATTSNPLTGKIIVELENATSVFNASASRTINGTGTLEIRKGIVNDSSTNGFIGTGNLLMESDLGRYITSRTGTQPELQGTYTLTAGTIEFANTSTSALIRVTPIYHNIDISGTNILSGGKDLVVNNLTKVTATGKLTIPSATDSESPYVLTARNGIQVTLGGTAHFLNNAQLLQDVGAVNSGNIIMDRFVEDMDNQMSTQMDYVYWSSPVSPQGLQTFSPGSQYVLRYNETNDYFYNVNFGTEPNFILGKGYAFSAEVNAEHPAHSTGYDDTYSFTGTPHNGNIGFHDLRKQSTTTQGFNLVGNPYPSNIHADDLFAANSSIYATVLFWTNSVDYTAQQQGSDYSGNNYAIYNKTGGNPATSYGDAFTIPSGLIKTGQGFMVQKKEVGTGSLSFNNNMRLTTNGTFYQKDNLLDKDRFWLRMTTNEGISNSTLIGFIPGATNALEKDYDAELMGGSDAIYSILDGEKLSVQGRAYPLHINDVIPLGVKFHAHGKYIIELIEKEGVFADTQRIYLKDKYLNKTHNLSNSRYEFESISGEFNNRFEILFKGGPVLTTASQNALLITQQNKDILIYSNDEIIREVDIVNLFGRSVYKNSNVNTKELRIGGQAFGKEILVVRVVTESGVIKTAKIINK